MGNFNKINNFAELRDYSVITDPYRSKISQFIDSKDYIIHSYFNRFLVWDIQKKSELIESILFGMPIPAIYSYTDMLTGKEIIIDGQQRLTTIKQFINNVFELKKLQNYGCCNDLCFDTLPQEFKNKILNYNLDFVCIKNINDKRIIFDIFKRYNTGGTQLNPQEIRNCVYNGPFNDIITELAHYEPFAKILEMDKVDRMEKEELVLRFLALYEKTDMYKANINKFLNSYIELKSNLQNKSSDEFTNESKEIKKIFKKAVDACLIVFGKDAFKTIHSKKANEIYYRQISKAVFDMQMLGFANFDLDEINRNSSKIKSSYEHLVSNNIELKPDYRRMSKTAVEKRISKWKEHINKIINE